MAQERIFTGEDREWLKENYPHLSKTACLKHFHCSWDSLKMLFAECGLTYEKKSNDSKIAKTKERFLWKDEGTKEDRCMDCSHYVYGGLCSKTGKWVGALWQKKCFTK